MSDVDPWLRPAQAARRIGITMQTLRRWMRKGIVAYAVVGPNNHKRIRQSEVDRQCSNVARETNCNI